ncbi:MAG: glycoside hydrolase family 92 protein [Rikenellaceae bacterium]|nr:glycoside hydrolase family 92 protein [Rikenellaceae bacterium]
MIKKILFTLIGLTTSITLYAHSGDFSPVDYVNPLVGTHSSFELSAGNTYPAIARPWGMNFWTPQTGKMGDGWAYVYTQNKIRGFKQTHQPSPWINDYGQFSIMPVVGKPEFNEDRRASWFSHKAEDARAYYYKVYLADHDVLTELTPTDRAAMFRFTFPEAEASYIVVDAFDGGSYVEVDKEHNRIIGYTTKNSGGVSPNYRNYFVLEFDKPFEYIATFVNGQLKEGIKAQRDNHVGAIIGFATKRGEQVGVRVASSFISHAQADINLQELGNKSFDEVKAEGKQVWNDILSRIEVSGGNLDQLRTFYSCLYRSTLFPLKHYEIDAEGEILHFSPHTDKVEKGYFYTGTGFWDTFRSLFPLLNVLYPSENRKMQEGFVNVYRESGFYPEWSSPGHRWCMVGNNSASVLADAYLKGIRVEDVDTMFEGILAGTVAHHPDVHSSGRLGHQYYNTLGYVPYDVNVNENVARTLEYAYDDWCIWRLAKELGRPEEEIELFAQRALNYRNVFDKQTNLMRGKKLNGEFQSPFSPLKWGDAFTEGNSWHYTWSVFHDPQGLIDLMGGDDNFISMLDQVFTEPPHFDDSYYGFPIHEIREMTIMNTGNYAHGNQPVQHMIYLYNYAGQPWKAQYWVRDVMNRFYSATPDGYCGDEDNGQTSAWYVFSALGFYPVCPASDEYVMGTPLFEKATLHLENGKTFTITAKDNSDENFYIESAKLNSRRHTRNYITYDDIMSGGKLSIRMSSEPNTSRGTAPADRPYSFSNELKGEN